MLTSLGEKLSDDEVDVLFSCMQANKDGSVNYEGITRTHSTYSFSVSLPLSLPSPSHHYEINQAVVELSLHKLGGILTISSFVCVKLM